MFFILSPAKNIIKSDKKFINIQKPKFKEEVFYLHDILKTYEPWELESIMKINPEIALKAFVDFQDFDFEKEGTPAVFAYNGLAFKNLNSSDFDLDDISFANEHLYILSAFYGILKACDGILPYRLDFNLKIKIEGKNIYKFWGRKIYDELFKTNQPIINLSSSEYYKTITPYLKENDVFITVDFLSFKKGKLRMTPTFAKMARGQMARFIIKNKIDDIESIKKFEYDGYEFEKSLSNNQRYVFIQK